MCKTTCDRPLIRATLERKRTSVGETMQQDIDTRFRRLEADKFATAGYVQRQCPSQYIHMFMHKHYQNIIPIVKVIVL